MYYLRATIIYLQVQILVDLNVVQLVSTNFNALSGIIMVVNLKLVGENEQIHALTKFTHKHLFRCF